MCMPAYCRCNKKGICRGCECAQLGRICTSCLPLRLGQCTSAKNQQQLHKPPASTNTSDPLSTVPKQLVQKPSGEQTLDDLMNQKTQQAYGAKMYSSFDTFDTSLWEIMWKLVVSMSIVQYSLPDGRWS